MNKKLTLQPSDLALFKEMVKGTKKLQQDKIMHSPKRKKVMHYAVERLQQEQVDASYYFSDEFQPNLATDGPTRYLREGANAYELKKLRRGDYAPEFFLDLHGLTQLIAKQEIGALIAACRREHVYCACIMHGHGKHILKQQTPLWLAQHPDVIAFHQAPKEWGGDAALLLLVENDDIARR
ncbi:MAG TPA: endonuclease SmrB [Proteus sp.]|nr:endonuclease SmrB [Proteus sp. (in: enterobacteria)]